MDFKGSENWCTLPIPTHPWQGQSPEHFIAFQLFQTQLAIYSCSEFTFGIFWRFQNMSHIYEKKITAPGPFLSERAIRPAFLCHFRTSANAPSKRSCPSSGAASGRRARLRWLGTVRHVDVSFLLLVAMPGAPSSFLLLLMESAWILSLTYVVY